MTLVRWKSPHRLTSSVALRDLENHLNQVFGKTEWFDRAWAPAVDFRETPDAFVIEADLPGVNKEEIVVSVEDDVLTIKGERKQERNETEKGCCRHERVHGTFQRSIAIPGAFDADNIVAGYKDGVLRVSLPKREEDKPKQIEVK